MPKCGYAFCFSFKWFIIRCSAEKPLLLTWHYMANCVTFVVWQWLNDKHVDSSSFYSYCPTRVLFFWLDVLSLSHGGQESGEVMWRSQQIVSQAGVRGGSQPQHGCPGGPCAAGPTLRRPRPAELPVPRRCCRTPSQPSPALSNFCLLAAGEDCGVMLP